MRKYYLSYFYENGYKTINLTNENIMRNKNPYDLSAIDSFTMNFSTIYELRNYLKAIGLIGEDVISDFCITSNRVNKSGQLEPLPIYNGNVILLSDSMGYISLEYAEKLLDENKFNSKFMLLLLDNYNKKYKCDMDFIKSQIVDVFSGLERILYIMSEIGYENLEPELKKEYNELLHDLKTIVFYRYSIGYDEKMEDVVFRRNADIESNFVINYKGIRNFVINTLNILETLTFSERKQSQESKVVISEDTENHEDDEREEFLYNADYKRSNAEILRDYNPSKREIEGEEDGHDYIKSLTRKELASALNTYATKSLRKRPREDGGAL